MFTVSFFNLALWSSLVTTGSGFASQAFSASLRCYLVKLTQSFWEPVFLVAPVFLVVPVFFVDPVFVVPVFFAEPSFCIRSFVVLVFFVEPVFLWFCLLRFVTTLRSTATFRWCTTATTPLLLHTSLSRNSRASFGCWIHLIYRLLPYKNYFFYCIPAWMCRR